MTETPRKQLDAIELLMQDHRELESLFREFEYLHARDEDAGHVVDAACAEFRTHSQLTSELFFPAVSEAMNDRGMEDLLAQVEEEHQAIRKLIAGVEMDLTQARYSTFRELYEYCYRVAGVVGLMCIEIFGYRNPKAKDYAVNLGVALQLTNIIRDLKGDAERGRIYLPQDELARFGYREEELLRGHGGAFRIHGGGTERPGPHCVARYELLEALACCVDHKFRHARLLVSCLLSLN